MKEMLFVPECFYFILHVAAFILAFSCGCVAGSPIIADLHTSYDLA
jgi:hypothetical protein